MRGHESSGDLTLRDKRAVVELPKTPFPKWLRDGYI